MDRAARKAITLENLSVQVALLNDIVDRAGAQISRLFSASEEHLTEAKQRGEATSGRELADLNLYYEIRFPDETAKSAVDTLDSLNQFEIVEFAAARVKPALPRRKLRAVILLLTIALCSTTATGAVTILPVSATTSDKVTIRVENKFRSEASVTSASISQSGNTFLIQQNVHVNCPLPNTPVVTSEFEVGPLSAGMYSVTAHINVDGPACTPLESPQMAEFVVAEPIPIAGMRGLLILAATLAVIAVLTLKR
jgi:hypothetical protein